MDVIVRRCPFLASVPQAFLQQSKKSLVTYAQRCPIMMELAAKPMGLSMARALCSSSSHQKTDSKTASNCKDDEELIFQLKLYPKFIQFNVTVIVKTDWFTALYEISLYRCTWRISSFSFLFFPSHFSSQTGREVQTACWSSHATSRSVRGFQMPFLGSWNEPEEQRSGPTGCHGIPRGCAGNTHCSKRWGCYILIKFSFLFCTWLDTI